MIEFIRVTSEVLKENIEKDFDIYRVEYRETNSIFYITVVFKDKYSKRYGFTYSNVSGIQFLGNRLTLDFDSFIKSEVIEKFRLK